MSALHQTLMERVEELIESHKSRELRSTTGHEAAIDELALRTEGLAKAVREIALELEKLAGSRVG